MSNLYQKILELKEKKKWLFYLLLIPFVVLTILELYNKYLSKSAQDTVRDTEKKDNKLEKKQTQAEQGAKYHEGEAQKIEKDIDKKKITKDWHLDE
jgi:hypothetical protein